MKRTKTGGRTAGTPNKATKDIKALAAPYGEQAVGELARIMLTSESDPARIAAAKELLDRGFGKAKQPIDHSSEDGTMQPKSLGEFYGELPSDPIEASRVYLRIMGGDYTPPPRSKARSEEETKS